VIASFTLEVMFLPNLKIIFRKESSHHVFILADENTNKSCLPILLQHCDSLKQAFQIEIPAVRMKRVLLRVQKLFLYCSRITPTGRACL
jgi:hypothetical protein